MKKKIIAIIFIITIVFAILTCFNSVKADINDIYDPITNGDNPLYKPAELITGAIKWIGVAILIGTVILKGIKYVTVSPEGKAEIKKDMVMLTIGAVLLFSFVTLVEIVYDFVNDSNLNNTSLNNYQPIYDNQEVHEGEKQENTGDNNGDGIIDELVDMPYLEE